MVNFETLYFEKSGITNVADCFDKVIESAKTLDINKIVLFSASFESPLKLNELCKTNKKNLIVVSFPFNREFKSENGDIFIPETSSDVAREFFKENGIDFIQSTLPFDPILSITGDTTIEMVTSTLSMFSGGMSLCINAGIIAFDNGYINIDEDIIIVTADTAILARASSKRNLFKQDKGFMVKMILCKPY